MKTFSYVRPSSITEAIALLDTQPDDGLDEPRLLAGGTDLLTLMKGGTTPHPVT